MARSATAQRTKKAAMATLGEDVRVGVSVRRSTDDEHQPYSIEAQDTCLAAYIDSQPGWRLVKRFPDDASGASSDKRPGQGDVSRSPSRTHRRSPRLPSRSI